MKITIRELRQIIREQVGTMVYIHNAGFAGMGGVSNLQRNKNVPVPGLGDEGEQEIEKHDEEQEELEKWSQWTVNVRRRKQPDK